MGVVCQGVGGTLGIKRDHCPVIALISDAKMQTSLRVSMDVFYGKPSDQPLYDSASATISFTVSSLSLLNSN